MKSVYGLVVLFSALALSGCGFRQVDEGNRGVEMTWGKMVGDPLLPGLHFYNPISSTILPLSVREEKLEATTVSFTKDTQAATVKYAITFYPDPKRIGHLYSQFGTEWDKKIIDQEVLAGMKDVIAKYDANELISMREAATQGIQNKLQAVLAARDVVFTGFTITNIDFNEEYEKAVEAKVTAMQNAAAEKNKTVQIQEQAKQRIATAQAEAESMRIKSQALEKNKGLTSYEAVLRWDGHLPPSFGGSGSNTIIDARGIMGVLNSKSAKEDE